MSATEGELIYYVLWPGAGDEYLTDVGTADFHSNRRRRRVENKDVDLR